MGNDNQPIFGDGLPNYKGNNGYGYEENELYANEQAKIERTEQRVSPHNDVIAIQAGWDYDKVDNVAAHCHMTKLGTAFFDDGEDMTDEHIVEQTVQYYANKIPNQTAVFLRQVQDVAPHAEITIQAEYSDDLGDDVSRFLPDVDMTKLDFDGLDGSLEQ